MSKVYYSVCSKLNPFFTIATFTSLISLFSFHPAVAGNDYTFLQGMKDQTPRMKYREDRDIYFEMSGYDISVRFVKGSIGDRKAMDDQKKKYKIKNPSANYSEPGLEFENLVIEQEDSLKNNPSVRIYSAYYFIQYQPGMFAVFHFHTPDQRDFVFEREFVSDYISGKLDPYILEDPSGEYMDFAGRNIQLGTACRWNSPHNFHCRGGQISWSEFPSFERAEINMENRIKANHGDNLMVISEDHIEVLFEEIPTTALRVAYLQKNSPNRYPLIVYYLCQEVRGRYISCIMSHYGQNRTDFELPDLLTEFMSIPSTPYWAANKYDLPEFEEYTESEKEHFKTMINRLEVRGGTFVPLGRLNDKFDTALSLGVVLGIPVKHNMSVDIYVDVGFPLGRPPVNIFIDGEKNETKLTSVVLAGLRYRYQMNLTNNLFLTPYAGLGVASLATDIERESSRENDKSYYP